MKFIHIVVVLRSICTESRHIVVFRIVSDPICCCCRRRNELWYYEHIFALLVFRFLTQRSMSAFFKQHTKVALSSMALSTNSEFRFNFYLLEFNDKYLLWSIDSPVFTSNPIDFGSTHLSKWKQKFFLLKQQKKNRFFSFKKKTIRNAWLMWKIKLYFKFQVELQQYQREELKSISFKYRK